MPVFRFAPGSALGLALDSALMSGPCCIGDRLLLPLCRFRALAAIATMAPPIDRAIRLRRRFVAPVRQGTDKYATATFRNEPYICKHYELLEPG
ncbi:MAG TPA: hypothetical protein VE631_09305 [Alphaproteobacteria bacterium]|nr:hypothetical protein [Alphaproteobacteria bacterium]